MSRAGIETWSEELTLALKMATAAEQIAMRYFGQDPSAQVKPDNSFLTVADLEIDRALTELVGTSYPADTINAEESERGTGHAAAYRVWAIDPIDHTNNFARGLDVFGTLISLIVAGQPVVGVITAPAVGHRWWAAKGQGAYRDGRRIHVSRTSSVRESHFTFSQLSEWDKLGRLRAVVELDADARWSFGSGGFTGQMWVAEGQIDVSMDSTGYIWDLAAPKIIVEEAGGRFTDVEGRDSAWFGTAVATNGALHDEVLSRLFI